MAYNSSSEGRNLQVNLVTGLFNLEQEINSYYLSDLKAGSKER
jgi:hypothetical protein